jgi:hypothetical protein
MAQSGGSCPDLPDDVEDELQDGWIHADSSEIDDVSYDNLRDSISRLDSGGQDAAISLIDKQGADGIELVDEASSLANDRGLSDSQTSNLIEGYDEADDVTVGPASNDPGTVQSQLNELDDNNVDVTDAMSDISGDETGYKQVAGEATTANRIYGSGESLDSVGFDR